MARLLVLAIDNGDWEKGDIIHVLPDGGTWGRLENLAGGFYQVDLPGLSYEAAREFKERTEDTRQRRFQVALSRIDLRPAAAIG